MLFDEHLSDVGPGWHPILRALDECFHYVFAGDEALAQKLKILQIKEKLGGLRIYINHGELPIEVSRRFHDFILMAETMSFELCEECGASGTDKRPPSGCRGGWIKNLCSQHHAERDARYEKNGQEQKPGTDELSAGQDDLLRRMRASPRVYVKDLCVGDRVRAEFLERKGFVEAGFGIWSGNKYYRVVPREEK